MDPRFVFRRAAAAVAATAGLTAGCANTGSWLQQPEVKSADSKPATKAAAQAPGGGVAQAQYTPNGPVPPGAQLPPPQPTAPPANPYPPPGYETVYAQPQQPGAQPGLGQAPGGVGASPGARPDYHGRVAPTGYGAALNLGPNENPLEKAVELGRKIEALIGDNKALLNRVQFLEASAAGRETALNESLREVESASTEVSKTRADLQTVRKEIAALKARVNEMDKEQAETLKAVIAALEKLIADEGGKK